MEYIILDLETTGLNNGLKLDEPVQIGIVDSNGNTLMNQLVCPNVEIDDEASKVHGIDYDMLVANDAPLFLTILPTLNRLIEGKTVCIYNAAYDLRILLNAAHNCGVPLTRNFTVECVMLKYAEAYKQPNSRGFKSQKLTASIEQQNLPVMAAHDAVADCLMTLELKKLLDIGIGVKTFDPTAPIVCRAISIEKKIDKRGKSYASFRASGGETINVFQRDFEILESKGWSVIRWLLQLEIGTVQPLSHQIEMRVTPNGEFVNLAAVLNHNPNGATN